MLICFRLHFRPKTPPPSYEPPCHLLPADDLTFIPSANVPYTMELQVLDEMPSTVLDTSSFVTAPFTFDDLEMDTLEEIPITDTRQQQQQQQSSDNKNVQRGANAGLITLNSSVSNIETDNDDDGDDEIRTICCSRFKVLDKCASSNKKHSVVSSTLTSPKLNSVNISSSDGRQQQQQQRQMNDNLLSNNANGLLTQFGLDGEFIFAWKSGVDSIKKKKRLQVPLVVKRKIIKYLTLTLVG